MDSYLAIARAVLKSSRQPLSARQILKTAHQLQLVPRNLFGRTQHKTLQARLASDILRRRSSSEFYRTGPGRFFLRSLQTDRSIPAHFRREYHAPVRAAQLGRFDVIAFPRASLDALGTEASVAVTLSKLFTLPWRFVHLNSLRRDKRYAPFRFLVILSANGRIFVDNRKPLVQDGDMHQQSAVGLEGYIRASDLSLFSADGFGLFDAAVRTLVEAFDLPRGVVPMLEEAERWSLPHPVIDRGGELTNVDLLTYISFKCNDITQIFDAIGARATAEWMEAPISVNDLARFDKWSVRLVGNPGLQRTLCD